MGRSIGLPFLNNSHSPNYAFIHENIKKKVRADLSGLMIIIIYVYMRRHMYDCIYI